MADTRWLLILAAFRGFKDANGTCFDVLKGRTRVSVCSAAISSLVLQRLIQVAANSSLSCYTDVLTHAK